MVRITRQIERLLRSPDLRLLILMAAGAAIFGFVDGSQWRTLLAPTLAYRPAVLFGLTLVFGWRGLIWSHLVFVAAFGIFLGWRGIIFVEPAYLLSHACALMLARRLAGPEPWLSRERSVLAFLVSAAVAPAIPALLNATTGNAIGGTLAGVVPGMVDGWLRGSAGMLVIVPAILVCARPLKAWVLLSQKPERREPMSARDVAELAIEIVLWAATLWMTVHFRQRYSLNITYLTFFPPLAFALFRGMRMSALALAGNGMVATTLWSQLYWADAISAWDLRMLIAIYSTTILVLAAVVDERSRAHHQLQVSRKMETLGRLAAGIAHDFNNLLTVIIGYGNLARAKAGKQPALQSMLAEIVKAGDSAATLTEQLLAFSQQRTTTPALLDLNEIVRATEGMLSRLLGAEIALVMDLEPGLHPVMTTDGEVQQILMNLTANAKDAMRRGGTLTIATANIDARDPEKPAGPNRPCVMLTAHDTGEGIAPEHLERVFEPFFTTKGHGSGLGLATVYGIVRQRGGWIELESRVKAGTMFRLYFPVAGDAPAVAAESAGRLPSRGTEATILLAEDHKEVLHLTSEVLRSQGYRVIEAEDGEQALEQGRNRDNRIDLLVSDVIMPNMRGTELAARLRVSRPELPVLYISAYAAAPDWAPENDDRELLSKPFSPQQLTDAVARALTGTGKGRAQEG